MNKKNLYLIAAVLASLVFIGFMTESEPKTFFGKEVSIWVYRTAWLFMAITFSVKYLQAKKSK